MLINGFYSQISYQCFSYVSKVFILGYFFSAKVKYMLEYDENKCFLKKENTNRKTR